MCICKKVIKLSWVFFPSTSRRGRSLQHPHREHPGCGKTRGGVLQDEKCKPSNKSPGRTSPWGCCVTSCLSRLPSSQMFQVIQPERALYIQANNCVEARDWIDILTKVSQCNRKRLSTYHPSAYLNGHWLCCKLSADTATGCTPCTGYVSAGWLDLANNGRRLSVCVFVCLSVSDVSSSSNTLSCLSSGLPANIQLDVDGDRETERIYSLFSTYMPKVIKMQGQRECFVFVFLVVESLPS